MNIYLTFADQPSGVYRSQVEDLVNYLKNIESSQIKLVAFISLRGFLANRKKIKSNVQNAMVLPMWPKLQNWLLNRFILYVLFFFIRPNVVIARSVFAGGLALKCRKRGLVKTVVYDGRGALTAEWDEYWRVDNDRLKKQIWQWEKEVVLQSNKQIAVSEKLVAYWKERFGFAGSNPIVIPCTLDKSYESLELNAEKCKELKRKLGFNMTDIVLVYSGSVAGWQSSDLLAAFLINQLDKQVNISVLFLSNETDQIRELKNIYPGRVVSTFLAPDKVPYYLMACDYGLLIREDTITNEVASPVKFAEYLACGLKIIISPKIGDYSEMVVENKIGILNDTLQNNNLQSVTIEEKVRCRKFALTEFAKSRFSEIYKSILNFNNIY